MEITFFSIPKAFRKHVKVVQLNALESWTRLNPCPKIMLLGRDAGVADVAQRYGCEHYGARTDGEYGVPLVNHAFERAQQRARTNLMCFTNADMIFLKDFMPAVAIVAEKFSQFLIVGRKTDLMVKEHLDFSTGWQDRLREWAKRDGRLHGAAGLDWFVFTRWLYKDIPPFAIGRRAWDNWLVWDVLKRGIPVVDATLVVLAVHQMNVRPKPADHPLIRRNRLLAGKAGRWGRTIYAPWFLTEEGQLKRRK